jgi:hypothetical protein
MGLAPLGSAGEQTDQFKYRCPDCRLPFAAWSQCRQHLLATGHASPSDTKGLQQRCMTKPPSGAAGAAAAAASSMGLAPLGGAKAGRPDAGGGEGEEEEEEEEEGGELSKRAAKKQRKVEREAAEVVAETPIASGIGHALLLKAGWSGSGGLRTDGIAEPVKAAAPAGKRGLAADDEEAEAPAPAAAPEPKRSRRDDAPADTAVAPGAPPPPPATSSAWRVELEMREPVDGVALRASLRRAGAHAVTKAEPI